MRFVGQARKKWLRSNRRTLLGVAPWIATAVAIFALQSKFAYQQTPFEAMLPGVEGGALYMARTEPTACEGGLVTVRLKAVTGGFLTPVAAVPGDQFRLTETGYAINGTSVTIRPELRDSWLRKARKTLGARDERWIPAGHFLAVNWSKINAASRYDWAYEIRPIAKIRTRLTHILLARDVSRIGEPVAPESARCFGPSTRYDSLPNAV